MPNVRRGRGRNIDLQRGLQQAGVVTTTQATSKWLRAESMPEKDNMVALSRWLLVRAEWLEYGDGPMRPGSGIAESPSSNVQAPTYVQADKYQKATPEHRRAVDDLVDQLLDLSPAQALKVKQAMELLIPPHDPRKD